MTVGKMVVFSDSWELQSTCKTHPLGSLTRLVAIRKEIICSKDKLTNVFAFISDSRFSDEHNRKSDSSTRTETEINQIF